MPRSKRRSPKLPSIGKARWTELTAPRLWPTLGKSARFCISHLQQRVSTMQKSWYVRTRLTLANARRHLAEMPSREAAILAEAAAGRISRRKANRKIANERAWATRCRKVISMSIPILDA